MTDSLLCIYGRTRSAVQTPYLKAFYTLFYKCFYVPKFVALFDAAHRCILLTKSSN